MALEEEECRKMWLAALRLVFIDMCAYEYSRDSHTAFQWIFEKTADPILWSLDIDPDVLREKLLLRFERGEKRDGLNYRQGRANYRRYEGLHAIQH